MTDIIDQGSAGPADFGLRSDQGGKDFGIFLPMANGGWILSSNKPTLDGSYAYNRKVALLAEELDFDFVMAMAKWKGFGGVTQHWRHSLESQMLIAALAVETKRVRMVATVHTLLQNPAVTAKMIATLDQISGGRAGLNLVTGSYKGEFEQMGMWRDNLDHDQRYDFADEWIGLIKRLWKEEKVSFDGKYFNFLDCESDPKPARQPFLVCAGTSPRGQRFTADQMDAFFCSGRDDAETAQISNGVKDMAKAVGRRVRTYTMMTLVIGETDAAAQAEAAHFRAGFDEGAWRGMMRAYGFLDAELGKENAFTESARSGFMSTHVIGSAETVADRLIAMFEQTNLDGMMVIFPDYLKSMPIFAERILPRIRARFPERKELAHVV